ncbi:hypothetical protein [Peterkaempfera griseoplana]|uniref:hypothetical protein n=1 Tax=Peterkaempfera griseoplana TaxID=66896 RepID=UPI0006E2AA4C|nr:hypothetical protein [Peterkaempfera griseoplana]
MKQIRLVGAAAVLVVGLTGLVGCSSTGSGASGSSTKAAGDGGAKGAGAPAVDVSKALGLVAKSTDSASSARMRMVERVPKVGTITASGVMSWKPLSMDLTMDTSGIAGASQAGAGSLRMVMTGQVMYMNMGAKAAASLQGKHWLKMDLAAVAKSQGGAGQQMLDQLNKQSGQDPTQSVGLITGSGNVKQVGRETVDGVSTTHYRGTVDITSLAEKQGSLGSMTATQRKQFETQMTKLGVKTMNIDLWANDQKRPVKVHETAQTANGPLDIVVDYSDYGTPVHAVAPPASDTLDLSRLLNNANRAAGHS